MPRKQTRYGTIKIPPCLWGIDFWETGDFIELRTQNTSMKSEIGTLLKKQNIYLTYCKQTTCFLFNQIEHWTYARLLIGSIILYAKWTKFVYTVLVSVQTFSYVKKLWRYINFIINTYSIQHFSNEEKISSYLTYICIFYFLWFHVSYECSLNLISLWHIFLV